MEQVTGEIRLGYSDPGMNEIVAVSPAEPVAVTRHFDQNEDFFLRLPSAFIVPALPIHHDVRLSRPREDYLAALRELTRTLIARRLAIFDGLCYVFDPAEVQRPTFYALHAHENRADLYLLRLDLSFRPMVHEVIERGSNDVSPIYRTDRVYVETDIIPLSGIIGAESDPDGFRVEQIVSDTWIGETGRGYFVQGIWLDRDLTKFFSKLFLPQGKRTYPYYPLNCKYRSVCLSVIDLLPARRWEAIPLLHAARDFLKPHIEEIQDALKERAFSEDLETFRRLKAQVEESHRQYWKSLQVRAYLNDSDMKEFVVENP
ncbi:MAG: hypothetical protein ACLFPO_07720 [Spirochaetaceae bacterium]